MIIRDDRENDGLFLANAPQVELIRLGDACQGFQIELLQSCHQGDLNGFQSLAAAGSVVAVILQCDVFRVPHFQAVKQLVQRRLIIFHVLTDFTGSNHFHDHWEVLFVLRCLIV